MLKVAGFSAPRCLPTVLLGRAWLRSFPFLCRKGKRLPRKPRPRQKPCQPKHQDLPLCLRKHQDLFPCWLSAKPSAKPGKAVGTLVAPPPGPPPKPVGAIMWPGGYMAGAEAAVVAKEPRMKAKGPPSKTRGTSAVERYSSAYSTVGHFPNGHLQDWLHAIAPKFFTLIMVGRLDRNQLLSYLYLLTGLLPSDRPPS